jgi:hypothetical protein
VDGYNLQRKVRQLLGESSSSLFIETDATYDYLYEAVCEFIRRTAILTGTQTITTVPSQSTFNLNPDFMGLFMVDNNMRYFIKYTQSGSDSFLFWKDYSSIVYNNTTTAVDIPFNFSIIDADALDNISGTATSTSVNSFDLSMLTDLATDLSNVKEGDVVINIADGSHGYVSSVMTSHAVYTSLQSGTNNDWTSGDSYVIIPSQKYALFLNPPSTGSDTITINYIKRPIPVYSDYEKYQISSSYESVITEYAAFLYKYRDREPSFGDKWFQHFDSVCRQAKQTTNNIKNKTSYRVNLRKMPPGFSWGSTR